SAKTSRRGWWQLLGIDHPKDAVEVVLRSGRIEKLVGVAVVSRAATELDSPYLVKVDRPALFRACAIDNGPNKGTGRRVEAIDRAAIGVVADQQSVAEFAK